MAPQAQVQTTDLASPRAARLLESLARRLLRSVLSLQWDERHQVADPKTFASGLTWKVLSMRPGRRVAIITLSVGSAVCGLIHPWVQKQFIDTLLASGSAETGRLLQLITLAFLAMLFSQVLNTAVRTVCGREGAFVNTMLSRALYRQTLTLTSSARSGRTVGETVNYYAQDVGAAAMLVEEFLSLVISAFIPFILAPLFVVVFLDMPMTPVLLTMAVLLSVKTFMSWRQSGFFTEFKHLATERLSVVNEWLQNIRIIRILGWTAAFERSIIEKRTTETKNRLKMVTNGSTMNSVAQVAPLLINAVGIATLVQYREDQITAGEIFALLWIFGVFLARPLRMMPWTLVLFLDGHSSCVRLRKYFSAGTERSDAPDRRSQPSAGQATSTGALNVRDLSLTLGGRTILDRIDLDVPAGSFVVITGEVGAGKTQLLLSLLRESPATFSALRFGQEDLLAWSLSDTRALFSYVPQDGFVMSGTLLENIKFLYDPGNSGADAASSCLELADFRAEAEGMASGLETEIGERGVNLSGGQRQRVSLARSIWHDRPFILLDDCLSAVDTETEKKLVENLICGAWKNKTRILVTHRLSVLPYADLVFELKSGRLTRGAAGTGKTGGEANVHG
jgi:ABC-type multidrug transport system fused ATPase/permease subunit